MRDSMKELCCNWDLLAALDLDATTEILPARLLRCAPWPIGNHVGRSPPLGGIAQAPDHDNSIALPVVDVRKPLTTFLVDATPLLSRATHQPWDTSAKFFHDAVAHGPRFSAPVNVTRHRSFSLREVV
jgi:hypothetical protein